MSSLYFRLEIVGSVWGIQKRCNHFPLNCYTRSFDARKYFSMQFEYERWASLAVLNDVERSHSMILCIRTVCACSHEFYHSLHTVSFRFVLFKYTFHILTRYRIVGCSNWCVFAPCKHLDLCYSPTRIYPNRLLFYRSYNGDFSNRYYGWIARNSISNSDWQ